MNLKSEKGITQIDITVAIIVIALFIAIIATLMSNINSNSNSIERKTEAMNYAINEIEQIKSQSFESLEDTNEDTNDFINIENDDGTATGYAKKITIIDYANLDENKDDDTIIPGLVKKVTVEISYRDGNATQTVDLSTVITKN